MQCKTLRILIVAFILSLTMCTSEKKTDNPLLSEFTSTPFGLPPFESIDSTHYLPAFIAGIDHHNDEITSIVSNIEEPDFENTILAFDRSGKMLARVSQVFYPLNSANTNPQMQAVARQIDPLMSQHADDIYLNDQLFARIKAVYERRGDLGLDEQQFRVVEKYYNDFVRRGSDLPPADKEVLRSINAEISMLSLTFGENLLAETNDNYRLVIDDSADLEGLPVAVIESAAATAQDLDMGDKWVFTLAKPSMIPFLQYADNRELRQVIYTAYCMRGNNDNANDNKEIVKKIAGLRAERAHLLGYDSHAGYVIAENMAKTPENVNEFLRKLWEPSLALSKKERTEMQQIIDAQNGGFRLEAWDWWYYAELVRKAKYDLDESELKPYFRLDDVRDGAFMVANRLYGITLTERPDLPLYHPDVEAFEVKEADGSHIGILYLDYFPRSGKRVGAWCTTFRSPGWEDGKRVHPVVSCVFNFTTSSGDMPSLLTWDEVNTLFHEFGHALHVLFTEGLYDRTAGDVARDYVELPSQIMENWAAEPDVLKAYAKHYLTGEIIPNELVGKLQKSSLFNKGFETVEYLAAAILDMDYHSLGQVREVDVIAFEEASMERIGLIGEIIPRYRSTYFQHIFSGGYSAGYYVYYWAEQLDADAFQAFVESGDIYNSELAARFRKYCLAESGNDDGMVQYIKFRGKEPSVEAMLERKGLK